MLSKLNRRAPYLAFLALCVNTGCYSEKDFVADLQLVYCDALFSCYDELDADCDVLTCLYRDEAACEDTLAGYYVDDRGACAEDASFRPDEGLNCVSALQTFDCARMVSGEFPPSCERACEPG